MRGWTLMVGLAAGCGDVSSATGSLGNLQYSLSTDYEVDGGLDEISLLTNHPVAISVSQTSDGEDETGTDEPHLVHSASAGELTQADDGSSFDLTVADTSDVTVSSSFEGDLLDRLELHFARPDHLGLVTWVRGPWDDDWSGPYDGLAPLTIEGGSQISFLAIPQKAKGAAIAGEFTPEIAFDPVELAVPDATVVNVYEERVWTSSAPVTFFAVTPGQGVVTISDAANELSVQLPLTVTPIAP